MSNLKRNIVYQTIYQILNTCVPLITAPYLARSLGANQQGLFSYSQSIANYFVLFAMLGVSNYGARVISSETNKRMLRARFIETYLMQVISGGISLILYSIYCIFICKSHLEIAIIQGISIIACIFDVTWYFIGTENFKVTITRNIIIRVLTVIAILLFIKTPLDLWKYTLIMSSSVLLSQLSLLPIIIKQLSNKELCVVKLNSKKILYSFKENLILFIPIAAITVYCVMDKTMLGAISTFEETGYYYNADKVINIPLGIITGVGTVMMPRMSNMISNNQVDEGRRLLGLSLQGIICISCAMSFGIASVANEFVPLFFGNGFNRCISLICVFSFILIIKSVSQCIRMQYLIPNKLDKYYVISVLCGAGINLGVNFVLIRMYGAMGAVISTIIAELIVCIIQFVFIRNQISIITDLFVLIPYTLFGLVMFMFVRMISQIELSIFFKLILEMLGGFISYSICCVMFWKVTKNNLFRIIKH